ncbi:unnamed protein product [Orchesella dallaii]|uniref:Neutral ceramidase n=1 Tax=Orchesella dallaii TaxID=48710 RepID=A0ABP1PRH3_9HEXA
MDSKQLELRFLLTLLGVFFISAVAGDENGDYYVGVGIADVTGPAADLGMMGYANPSQSAKGIHTRLYSRAFVFRDGPNTDDPLVAFVSADIGMVDQLIKFRVVEKLNELYVNGPFNPQNVLLSGTHTHSGPGAYLQYLMYGITSLGFYEPSFNAIVDGMVQSIVRAYEKLQPGRLHINSGIVQNANINRSPSSYLANPPEERAQYDSDVDKQMVLVRIEKADGTPLGAINWFAVHPTSMNNTNRLISGDNKGYAEMLFESEMNPNTRPGKGEFVAAFASSNLGDVSPNVMGPRCIDTGLPCDFEHSTCGGLSQKCIAFGPGTNGDMEESTEIIGERQYKVAKNLFNNLDSTATQLKGAVDYIHQYVNMTNYEVEVVNPLTNTTETVTTCPGAMGYSFAGGTTDGPGLFDFVQGELSDNPFWNLIRDVLMLGPLDPVFQQCHYPKPILLPVGLAHQPYEWVASVVETQILRVGNLYIIGIPGELTTMAGRRLRKAVESVVVANAPDSETPHVVIAGLSNVYTHYITTYEEYQKQRYEAASTIYGPHTLQAYLKQYDILAASMLDGTNLDPGTPPPDLSGNQFNLIGKISRDTTPFLKNFGDCLLEPLPIVNPNDTVVVKFAGGHPRHDSMREGTFLLVEKCEECGDDTGSERWTTVATDADWSTKFHWSRPKFLSTESVIEISWKVPADALPGNYRIRHFGYHKPAVSIAATPRAYQGETRIFVVNGTGNNIVYHPKWTSEHKQPSKINSAAQFWHALASSVKDWK